MREREARMDREAKRARKRKEKKGMRDGGNKEKKMRDE